MHETNIRPVDVDHVDFGQVIFGQVMVGQVMVGKGDSQIAGHDTAGWHR